MSKTHSVLTKESAIAISVLIGLVAMTIVTIIMLAPGVVHLLTPQKTAVNQNPIDQEIVKQAIEAIGK
jgi:hypothetical protein